jgi:RNA recognition motif-containing protein
MNNKKVGNAVIVSGIHKDVTEEELRALFSQYGNLECAKIRFEKGTAVGKGLGIAVFQDAKSAEAAQLALNNYELNGQALKVDVAGKK